ncbi:c-type cytochrome [Paraburkholderia megapolitana]|uniref:Glucose/arabinose dehydrogenase, beta-propeller fold n=1 Tax=Paraburkholderia megapolitana TaxID=420953 RepID=A0A1I3KSE0_9BURK|nr:c-type cytochrome [Paraburkholderia megapolitana]QDQ80438.1 c-type cytochrome [Paraburkholderia megapolitana]SFI75429.1 Glucose/arabinose dehydrogenase, beta-propeller fold [Paraburkholderia megapolitana]
MRVPSASTVGFLTRLASAAGLAAVSLALVPTVHLIKPVEAAESAATCNNAATGISLPAGFCATVFADNLGHVRQMAVAADGTLYVNMWSGTYYQENTPPDGGYLVALKDTKGVGQADVIQHFGETAAEGGHGGTGLKLYNNAVYAESNDRIMRYALKSGDVAPSGKGEVIVSGLPVTGDHPMHPIAITPKGDLLVDLGSATNACEKQNRTPHSPGNQPCTEKETRAGIWRYDANKTGQTFSAAERYISGLRNGEGIALDGAGRAFSTQHGRDQLHEDWPERFTAKEGQELPAEVIVELKQGADYGWPECYYDGMKKKLMLAPEYGGDGKKIGLCANRTWPVAAFPGHWAPNDLTFYEAQSGFPSAYRGGAFVAFHGSWNRAPARQGGYNVVFQPFRDGKGVGNYVIFADGFAGAVKEPGQAAFRPTGLAVAPDGALFISDDVHGRIWRVTYSGDANAPIAAAPTPTAAQSASGSQLPPEGIHPDAGKPTAGLPVPPGSSKAEVELGERVFLGQVGGATCAGCHGSNGKGSGIGADLTKGTWLWSDGSLSGLGETIAKGVAHPKEHSDLMPPMGGVQLSQKDLKAVTAYVWAIGHQGQ